MWYPDGDAGGGEATEGAKVAKIGVIAPLSGDLSALGLGIQNSVDLAIKQANEAKTIPGWTLELDAAGRPGHARTSARTPPPSWPATTTVIGVVGTLNSSVSQSVQPVLAAASIVQVSPANTNPTLTQGPDLANPKRAVPDLLPHLHHRRHPGPVRGRYLLRSPASRRSPPSTTRRPTGRAWSPRSPRSSRACGGDDRRGRDDQPGRQGLLLGDQQGQGGRPGGRLLRR